MKGDLKFTAIVAAAASVPLFLFFGWLWNPHGSIGSVALHVVGLLGIYPFLYVVSYQSGVFGVALAALAQYAWFAVWVFLSRRLWRVWRPDALPQAPLAPE